MVAYSFQSQYRPAILSGDKDFTLRNAGKKRHARIAEEMSGRMGRVGPTFFRALCVLRATLVFSPEGLHRVLNPSFTPEGEALWRLLMSCEQGAPGSVATRLDALARRDGFKGWAEMARWHTEKGVNPEDGLCWRELIAWSPATLIRPNGRPVGLPERQTAHA